MDERTILAEKHKIRTKNSKNQMNKGKQVFKQENPVSVRLSSE